MKWILYVAGALALLLLIITTIGYLLPRDHVASRTAKFRKPPAEVFVLISESQAWRPNVADDQELQLQQVESDPPRRYVTRIGNPDLPYGGTWTWEIRPTAEGSEVHVTENGFVINPIFRFISRFVIGHHASIDTCLKHLAAKLE